MPISRRSPSRSSHPALGSLEDLPPRVRPLFEVDEGFQPPSAPQSGDWLAEHDEPGQSFEQFVDSRPNRPTEQRDAIYLAPLVPFSPHAGPSLGLLKSFAEAYFSMPIELHAPICLDDYTVTERSAPRSERRQIWTRDVLSILGDHLPPDAFCMIAVTMVDLYPDPNWNFVFGQASYRERVGVYSVARYGSEDPKRLLKRSMKVMAHEIGHMFGMRHCTYLRCGMNGSNHLGESDRRPIYLCPIDLRKLHWSIEFEPVERYRRLQRAYAEAGLRREVDWIEQRLEPLRSDD